MPEYAGIQVVSQIWMPASAGMTFPLSSQVHGIAFNRRNTLSGVNNSLEAER